MATVAKSAKYTRGGGESCAVVGCSNNRKKLYLWRQSKCGEHGIVHSECPCLSPFSLYKMPSDERKLQWISALNRKVLPKSVFVCSVHFVEGKPTVENNAPSLHLGYDVAMKKRRRVLKRKLIPDTNSVRDPLLLDKSCSVMEQDADDENSDMEILEWQHELTDGTCKNQGTQTEDSSKEFISTGTQWMDITCSLHDHNYINDSTVSSNEIGTQTVGFSESKAITCKLSNSHMSTGMLKSDSEYLLYTGITMEAFNILVKVMQATPLNFTMAICDQILLTLMRLRLNLLFADLGHRFGISESQESMIFSTWLSLLSEKLIDLVFWLPRETIKATLPQSFQERYPKTTVIIDCAETFIQRPKQLKTRGETFSNYKSHNTVKYLVGISPHGQIMFISKGFGGRASDKFIVENSGFLDYLLPGDEVMADRGFTIEDLLFPRRVKLNIPAFTKGKDQLTEYEVTETRRIACVRIHIERAIRRLKVFKILSNVVPVSSVKKLDDILIVCSALVNLRPELIKDNTED